MAAAGRVLVVWEERFRIGLEHVDREHRELIALINRIHASVFEPARDTTTIELLHRLQVEIGAHFASEERLMERNSYDGLEEHRDAHLELLRALERMIDHYEAGRYVDVDDLGRDLERWFGEHFRGLDAALHGRL